jgi:polysaccharide export outer membrane protein
MVFRKAFQFLVVISFTFLVSCKVYKRDILFQLPEDGESELSTAVYEVEKNYVLQPNDWIEARLFNRDGEQLINPNVPSDLPMGNNQAGQNNQQFRYLVQADGSVKLPMIGTYKLAGLTIDEAERLLEKEYDLIYKGSFLKIVYSNKRVVVLGAMSAVVPLQNENTSLLEVLASVGGVQFGAQAQNIRVIRGSLNQPEVFLVDLTTIEGMRESIISLQPGDVIYIEPWRRPWQELIRDFSPILGITSSVSTLVFLLISSLNNA